MQWLWRIKPVQSPSYQLFSSSFAVSDSPRMKRAFSLLRTKASTRTSFTGDVQSSIEHYTSNQRDPLYYNTPLILLVSHGVALHHGINVCLNIGRSGFIQITSELFRKTFGCIHDGISV